MIFCLGLLLFSCSQGLKRHKQHFFAMDTMVEVVLYAPSTKAANHAMDALAQEAKRIEQLFGAHVAGSAVWQINHRTNKQWIQTLPEVVALVQQALDIGSETKGIFDCTIGPVKWLWGFGADLTPARPADPLINQALTHVNFRNVSVRKDTLFFADTAIRIDLGGIAKGYALKKMAEIAKAQGISSFMINAGGDIVCGDPKPGNEEWVIGIRHPRNQDSVIATVRLSNTSIVTSGDYERFFLDGKTRYHHIFDIATGYPAQGTISATVICKDPIRADAFSTAIFIRNELAGLVEAAMTVDDTLGVRVFGDFSRYKQ
ncbi:MAG: hypothetical protein A2487_03240 [Candidatus Raymondbacteria bacterium RifOxyC12_full_50_8]|nr:MAG: hypothetical protein A2487_03240 [Candidatus Raymondbacteria bacterium RifOxyC12_full_50_8]